MPEEYLNALWIALATFGVGLLAVASRVVKAWGDRLVDRLTQRIEDEGLRSKVELARTEIGSAVDMISQTAVRALKEASKDGKLTPDEAKEAMAMTVAETRRRFSQEFWVGLMEKLELDEEGIEDWIRAQAEAYIYRSKGAAGD